MMFEPWYKIASMIPFGLDITRIKTHRLPIDELKMFQNYDFRTIRKSSSLLGVKDEI
ncbi:MAG: hypothetical protein KAQ93_07075 [Spirochaetales bacterium]|nr:hypothetical protein [Spirochaetales bacterium]